jgi:hypothetical protein
VRLGVTLLSVNEVRELGRVPEEEDRGVVEHPVEVTVFGPQLDGEATGITGRISGSRLTTDGGESDSGARFLAN